MPESLFNKVTYNFIKKENLPKWKIGNNSNNGDLHKENTWHFSFIHFAIGVIDSMMLRTTT